jgi:predicted secreted hydrolase
VAVPELKCVGRLIGCLLCVSVGIQLIIAGTLPDIARAATSGAPVPIEFPRDDGRHDSKIEWWYFTGHFESLTGDEYGFEDVVFRARPSGFEGYASHFAITDLAQGKLHYDQKILGAAGVAGDKAILDLNVGGWTMLGGGGKFALKAAMRGYAIDLQLTATKPAALHDGDGYIDYGDGTGSYYYSWTRLSVAGTIETDAGRAPVTGIAWMDHQWGNFATYQAGGWDWYSAQLDNGVDVMLYLLRGQDGQLLRVDGTIVEPDGTRLYLRAGDFSVVATGEWTSPETGTRYPSGWQVQIPGQNMQLSILPRIKDQELDSRPTTGVIYWEGNTTVLANRDGRNVTGVGYAELTGYAPFEPPKLPSATPTEP